MLTALLNFIVDGNLPFSVIQQVAGHEVRIPKTGIFMNFMKDQFNLMKTKLTEHLNEQEYLCVTCDVWSSRAQSYLGMSVHFIDDDFERESYVLAFRELKYKQTHVVMAKEIIKVFAEHGIHVEKITNIVTDGGSAFCKAFKVYGKGSDPLIEIVETIETNDKNDDNDENYPFIQYDDGEYFYSNIIRFDDNELTGISQIDVDLQNEDGSSDLVDVPDDDYLNDYISTNDDDNERDCVMAQLPPHRRCLSHILNLFAGDFEKKLPARASTALITTLSKLQSIWVCPRRSSTSKSICKDILGCQLKMPVETRWNSKFNAIQQIHDIGIEKMMQYVTALKTSITSTKNLSNLLVEDFKVMAAYIKVMKPIANSLDRLQGEKNCGQGYILPTLTTMLLNIRMLEGSPLLKSFQETMLKLIEKRFKNHLKIEGTNKDLVLATMSTPRLKTKFTRDEIDWSSARNILITECNNLSSYQTDLITEEAYENSQSDDEFFVTYNPKSNRRSSVEQNIEAEVDRYLNDDRREIKILNEYPIIKKVYLKFNTTLCSSGAIERVFSQSSLIFTPRRNRISATNFEACLLLKYNRKLFVSHE